MEKHLLSAFNTKLADIGWFPLPEKESDRRGHYRYRNKSGESGYLKEVTPWDAFCERLAGTLGRAAGIPCPENHILRHEKMLAFACLSVAPPQEHAPMVEYAFSDADIKRQITTSVSEWLPYAEFIGHPDLHKKNIIVVPKIDNGKKVYRTYPIDFEGLNLEGKVDLRQEWKDYFQKVFFPIDDKAYWRGKNAIDKLGETNIVVIIKETYAYCRTDERDIKHLPSEEDIIEHLCAKYWGNNVLPGDKKMRGVSRPFTGVACVLA